MDRTGAAKTKAATKLRSGKAKLVAQEPHERHRGIALEFPLLPIHMDVDHGLLLSTRLRRAHLSCLRMLALPIEVSKRKQRLSLFCSRSYTLRPRRAPPNTSEGATESHSWISCYGSGQYS